jgi:hypothetical protein
MLIIAEVKNELPMYQEIEFAKFSELSSYLEKLQFKEAGRWVFRGHSDKNWKLRPSLWRQDEDEFRHIGNQWSLQNEKAYSSIANPDYGDIIPYIGMEYKEYREITYFIDYAEQLNFIPIARWRDSYSIFSEISAHHKWSSFGLGYYDSMALAQHYKIKTSLLDWSLDPFIATSFAIFGDQLDSIEISIFCLNATDIPFLTNNFVQDNRKRLTLFRGDHLYNVNIRAQNGIFTVYIPLNWSEYAELKNMEHSDFNCNNLLKLNCSIKSCELFEIRKKLNIGRRSPVYLFPSLANCAAYAQKN